MAFHSPTTNPNPPAPVATGTIADNDFRVIAAQIGFNSQGITRDAGGAYDGPQWVDHDGNPGTVATGDVAYPLSFWRSIPAIAPNPAQDRFVTAAVEFWIEGNPTAPKYKVSGAGTGPGGGTFEAETTLGSEGGKTVLKWSTTSSTKLPITIKKGNLEIDWKVLRSNIPAKPIAYGKSKDVTYVTGAEAAGAYETVLDLGCTGANGIAPGGSEDANGNGVLDAGEDANGNGVLDDDKAVVNGIWGKFLGNSTTRVDGTTMSYSHDPAGFAFDAAGMLARTDGRGQCTAWADLLVITLGTQGAAATSTRIDPPGLYFAVRPMPAQGSGGSNYVTGTQAAGGFNFHQVVRVSVYPDRIYDPSYGGLTIKTDVRSVELKYEDENITHLWVGDASTGYWVADTTGDLLQPIFTP